MENKEQHVDWAGLVYYDAKIKEYINSSTASKEEQVQLRSDLEQLEQLLTTLTMSFATDKDHIYKHINECMNGSATKEELQAALDAIREEIKTLTGVDLSEYATKDFVEQKLDDLQLSVELPDDLVTTEDIKDFVTREEVAEEIGKIVPPEVDLTSLATKEQLSAVEAKIPSVEGLASETYVDEKVASILVESEKEVLAIDLSEYESYSSTVTVEHDMILSKLYDSNLDDSVRDPSIVLYLRDPRLDDFWHIASQVKSVKEPEDSSAGSQDLIVTSYAVLDKTDETVKFTKFTFKFRRYWARNPIEGHNYSWRFINSEKTTTSQLATLADITELDNKINEIEIPTNISTFTNDAGYLTSVPEEYVTDEELAAKGYLTEHQSLEGLATEQFVADEIAKLDCVSSTTVENIIEEKIEEVVTGGATVSSISYGTF